MATLRVRDCRVEPTSIRVVFSEQVDASAISPTNYTVFAPSAGISSPLTPLTGWQITIEPDNRTVLISPPSTVAFLPGEWILVTAHKGIAPSDTTTNSTLPEDETFSRQVPGGSDPKRVTRDVEDAISYPILTEEVAYRPSPVGIQTSGAGGISGPGGSNLGQVALQAVSDVLGWKANPSDPKGFIGALTQSFTLTDVEGHIESTWKPRSYAVQTDLGGGITGAQASLYMRAKDALDQSLTLLDGLYPLDPEADPEYVRALREMARSQMTEIVKELGVVGLPSILRINTYFGILLGQDPTNLTAGDVRLDPDQIEGTLGELRDTYGIFFQGNQFNNSVQDEQDITNFRVISDYMTSLLQSWIANREFFILKSRIPAFFGTQLVLISRQFNVIAETVNELRFALDSVFIGPNERQTLLLEFEDHSLPPMFLEDVLDEVDNFVAEEGPRLLRDGGKISVTNNILPVVDTLRRMIQGAHHPKDQKKRVPDGFKTARVRHALDDLQKQLTDLVDLTKQVEQQVPPSEDKLTIGSIIATDNGEDGGTISIIGDAFDPDAEVIIQSSPTIIATPGGTVYTEFFSPQRIDVPLDPNEWSNLQQGLHTITVINPDGESAAVTLPNGITSGPTGIVISPAVSDPAKIRVPSGKQPTSVRRPFVLTINGQPPVSGQKPARPPAPPSTPPTGGGTGSSGGVSSTPSDTNPAATASSTASTAASVSVDQQLTALQDKHEALQQGLADLQNSHSELSQKIEDVQKNVQNTLANHLAEAKSTLASFVEEVKGLLPKMPGLGESKKTKGGKDE